MDTRALIEELRSVAQNDEMVDQGYTEMGHLLNMAADKIERLMHLFDASIDLLDEYAVCFSHLSRENESQRKWLDAATRN